MKFKAGDKVRVREDLNRNKIYYMDDKSVGDTCVDEMMEYAGKFVTIEKVCNGKYRIDETGYNWTDEMFESNYSRKIVITTDGKETLARLYEDNKVIKKATAVCSPGDTFDFVTGAKIAFERLTGESDPVKEKPKYFSGKAVCVEAEHGYAYTVGKIYEFKEGKTKLDSGVIFPFFCAVSDLDEFNKMTGVHAKMIPLVEE